MEGSFLKERTTSIMLDLQISAAEPKIMDENHQTAIHRLLYLKMTVQSVHNQLLNYLAYTIVAIQGKFAKRYFSYSSKL